MCNHTNTDTWYPNDGSNSESFNGKAMTINAYGDGPVPTRVYGKIRALTICLDCATTWPNNADYTSQDRTAATLRIMQRKVEHA